MSRKNHTRFLRKGGYITKHEEWLRSPAYQDLHCVARCLLDEFLRIYRPDRNGRLSISVASAAKLLRVNKDTAARAFHELAEHGFIRLKGVELWQERRAREWCLTIMENNGRNPSDEWRDWRPSDKGRHPTKTKSRSRSKGQHCPLDPDMVSDSGGQGLISPEFVRTWVNEIQ